MLHQELAPQSNSSTATISDVLLLFDLWLTGFGLTPPPIPVTVDTFAF